MRSFRFSERLKWERLVFSLKTCLPCAPGSSTVEPKAEIEEWNVQVHLHVVTSKSFTRLNYFYFLFFSFFWNWLQLQLIALSARLEFGNNWNRSRSKRLKCVYMDISYYENDETGDNLNVLWFHFQGVNCEKKLWMSNIFYMLQLTGLNEVSTTFTTQKPLWNTAVVLFGLFAR